jgi:HemY protein
MAKLFVIFLLLLIAVWIGWEIHQDSGFVLIIFRQWEIETSLWMAALLALIFFVVIYAILRIIVRGTLWPHQWRLWREARREKNAQRLIEVATCELIEEKWAAAEQHFCEAARAIRQPFLEYTAAAVAAQAQGANGRREEYLRQAYQSVPQAEIPLGILQAKLQIQGQQWPEAAITLKKLQATVPQHPVVKQLSTQMPVT